MLLSEFLDRSGHLQRDGRKCKCPSGTHPDNRPSAILNDESSVYCFVCQKLYTREWIERKFDVHLDKVTDDNVKVKRKPEKIPMFIDPDSEG